MRKESLRLRAVEPEDLDLLYRIENDPSLWEVSQTTGPYSRYQLKQYIAQNQNNFFADRQLRLVLEVEEPADGPENEVGVGLKTKAEVKADEPVEAGMGVGLKTKAEVKADEPVEAGMGARLKPSSVGILDLCNYSSMNHRAEVGIMVDEAYRRRGIALQALQWAEQHAFGCLGLHQLYAYVAADNEPSLRLFRAAGYEEAGCLRQWVRRADGAYVDVLLLQRIRPMEKPV